MICHHVMLDQESWAVPDFDLRHFTNIMIYVDGASGYVSGWLLRSKAGVLKLSKTKESHERTPHRQ